MFFLTGRLQSVQKTIDIAEHVSRIVVGGRRGGMDEGT
jgi:hypothetical protein